MTGQHMASLHNRETKLIEAANHLARVVNKRYLTEEDLREAGSWATLAQQFSHQALYKIRHGAEREERWER
jgi:hypothetical protein